MPHTQSSIKVIGTNGQILLGKQYAGRQVLVEEQEPGVWLIRIATVIPDNEHWLHQQPAADLQTASAWALANPPDDTNVENLLEKLNESSSFRQNTQVAILSWLRALLTASGRITARALGTKGSLPGAVTHPRH